jgi:hypothetical protein
MAKTKPPELEYIIVVETSRVLLQECVNYYIGAGYVPAGGIAILPLRLPFEGMTFEFYQAMVKKTE